jgi:hypothetical protein
VNDPVLTSGSSSGTAQEVNSTKSIASADYRPGSDNDRNPFVSPINCNMMPLRTPGLLKSGSSWLGTVGSICRIRSSALAVT